MKCSLGVSNLLEEISSLSHSVVFLYFFALIAEEGFFISSSAIKKNTFESVLMRWMNLEPVIHSEVKIRTTNIIY